MEAGEERRSDTTLKEVEHHQSKRIGGHRAATRIVYALVGRPRFYGQHQGTNPAIQLAVAEEQVRVQRPMARVTGNVDLQVSTPVTELQDGHFRGDEDDVSGDEALAVGSTQNMKHTKVHRSLKMS